MGNAYRAYKDDKLPENYFRLEISFFRIVGIELVRQETILYKIYSRCFLLFLLIFGGILQVYELYAHRDKMDIFIGAGSFLVSHMMGTIKTILLYLNRKKYGEIIKTLHHPPFKFNKLRGGTNEEVMVRKMIRTTELQCFAFACLCLVTLVSGVLNAIKSRLFNPPEEWMMPYTPISVIDVSKTPVFEIALIYEIFQWFSYAILLATMYCFISILMAHTSLQFKMLSTSIRGLHDVAHRLKEAHQNEENPHEYYLSIALKSSIEYHLKVLGLADAIENLCSIMFLIIFLGSILLLCLIIYFASLFPIASVEFLEHFIHAVIITSQVAMYCHWGNEVSLQAYDVALAIMECGWEDSNQRITKGCSLIMLRAQKPLIITAGKFLPLDMETFTTIVKVSYTFFTMLKNTNSE